MAIRYSRAFGRAIAGLSLFLFSAGATLAQETWDANYYNPAGDPDVLLLPIPCGGKIALKKVVTITEDPSSPVGPLSDQRIVIGRDAGRTRGYIEENHHEYISGTLMDDETHERYYLIGAYEVTQGQYDAVMKGPDACPRRMSRKLNLPVTNVSWYDAIDFTRKLNIWLYSNPSSMMATLSQIGAANGFARLPSEVEWEFAARGGSAVPAAVRNEPVFFNEGTIDDYAWYNGAMSSSGKAKPVGKKKPNPLGLYDVYGNAAEIVQDSFRMTRSDRLHGAIGGFVVRGGSFLDSPDLITSARRDENPFFDAQVGGEFKRRSMGFRIAVSTSSIPRDVSEVPRLETAFEETQRQVDGPLDEQPLQQMQAVADQVQNAELQTKIRDLQGQLQDEFARRNELKARNVRVMLSNGGLQAMEVFLSARAIKKFKAAYKQAKLTNTHPEFYAPRIEAEYNHYTLISNAYYETVDTLADYAAPEIRTQSGVVKQALSQRNDTDMIRFVEALETSIDKFRHARNQHSVLHFLDEIPTPSID